MRTLLIAAVFVLSACDAVSGNTTPFAERDRATAVADDTDPPEANCLTRRVTEGQENGSEVWLRPLEGEQAADAPSVASDRFGNAYVTRAEGGAVKLSASGEPLWSKPYGLLVAVAANDDVILAGTFRENFSADGVTLSAVGGTDVYVIALDPTGTLKWSTVLGGAGDDTLLGLAASANGRVIVSGGGLGTAALDAGGSVAWTRRPSGAIAVDTSDNVLVTGGFRGTEDFGGGELTSVGGTDVFVAKLTSDGTHVFSARFGDAGQNQRGEAITSDFLGNILVSGVFDGSVDFGSGPLSLAPCPSEVWCKTSGFVVKLDPSGTALWSVGRGPVRAFSGVVTDALGNVIVSGATPGGVPSYRIPLLVAFDAEGDELWERSEWPASGVGSGRRVAVDPCGDLLWALSVRPSLDAGERAYLAKLAF